MKIIHIFASATWGGGEQFVYDLTERLLLDGHQVILISKQSNTIAEMVTKLNIPYFILPLRGVLDLGSSIKLARTVIESSTDIIHVHHFKDAFTAVYASLFCKLRGVKVRVIMTRHLVRRGKDTCLYRWLYSRVHRVVFVSQCARKAFLSGLKKYDLAKFSVINNSVPDRSNNSIEGCRNLRAEFGLSADTTILLFSGRCVAEKGCHILLQACGSIKDKNFALFFAGNLSDTDYAQELNKIIAANNLASKVFFLGFTTNIYSLLRQSDVVISPSIVAESGGPLSIVEAMQSGCAVICSNNGSQPEIVEDGISGILIAPNDTEGLSHAIAKCIDDKELRAHIGMMAKQHFYKDLSYEVFYNKYLKVYAE